MEFKKHKFHSFFLHVIILAYVFLFFFAEYYVSACGIYKMNNGFL